MWDPGRDQRELDNRRRLTRDVLRSLDGVAPWTLRMLAPAVGMSAPPIDRFASAFQAHANTIWTDSRGSRWLRGRRFGRCWPR
jgi:hypothetical protein